MVLGAFVAGCEVKGPKKKVKVKRYGSVLGLKDEKIDYWYKSTEEDHEETFKRALGVWEETGAQEEEAQKEIYLCPECGAEFKEGEFECPVCGSTVAPDANMCMVCSERFEEEELFECPHCGSPVNPDSIICEKCDEEFWSPVKPAEPTEVEALVDMEESPEMEQEMASS